MIEAVYQDARKAVAEDPVKTAVVKNAAYKGLDSVLVQTLGYMNSHILYALSVRILYKKCLLIKQAHTMGEIKEIVKPSVPKERSSGFYEGEGHVAEEEMIMWSKASLEAPLNHEAYERYMELFKRFFPEEAKRLFS